VIHPVTMHTEIVCSFWPSKRFS